MLFKSRFFYNTEEGEGGNGSSTTEIVETPIVAEQPQEVVKPTFSEDVIKGWGFDSIEAANEYFAKVKETSKSPEQIKREQEKEKADFIKFSTDEDIMGVEEINTYESLKSKSDTDLVFENYLKAWQEENPDYDAKEAREQAKQDFEEEYHLNASNDKQKARWEQKIAKEAAELRKPLEEKFGTAKSRYDENKTLRTEYPAFNKFIDDIIETTVTDKLVAKVKDGEVDVDIDIELTKEQKKEIEKSFKNEKTLYQYLTNKDSRDAVKEKIASKIQGFIKLNNYDRVVNRSYEVGKGIGVKNGSTIGAENLFGTQQSGQPPVRKFDADALEESNRKIAAARERFGK